MIGRQHSREFLGDLGSALADLRASAASEFLDVTGIAALTTRIAVLCEGLRSPQSTDRKS